MGGRETGPGGVLGLILGLGPGPKLGGGPPGGVPPGGVWGVKIAGQLEKTAKITILAFFRADQVILYIGGCESLQTETQSRSPQTSKKFVRPDGRICHEVADTREGIFPSLAGVGVPETQTGLRQKFNVSVLGLRSVFVCYCDELGFGVWFDESQ